MNIKDVEVSNRIAEFKTLSSWFLLYRCNDKFYVSKINVVGDFALTDYFYSLPNAKIHFKQYTDTSLNYFS